jgi:signal peptidase I
MEKTIAIDDHVGVQEGALIHRGSIVVFVGPDSWQDMPEDVDSSKTDFVKRVIGLPGEHVVCCDPRGRLTVDGRPLREPYIYPGDKPSQFNFDVKVPSGRLWLLGDHRNASADSRSHISDGTNGTVPISNVIGVVVRILSPPDRERELSTPAYGIPEEPVQGPAPSSSA